MTIEIAFFETDQIFLDAQRPESLCGVNSIISTFLGSLKPLTKRFNFSILVPEEQLVQMRALLQVSQLGFIKLVSYEDFATANRVNDLVILQVLGHRIDRAAAFRARVNRAWTVIGMTHDLFHRDVYRSLFLYIENQSAGDAIVCASRSAQAIIRSYLDRIQVCLGGRLAIELPLVPHGVDPRTISRIPKEKAKRMLGFSDDELVFLYFGRLSIWQKADLCGLIRCFADRFKAVRARLVLAGGAIDPENNPEIKEIIAQISALGLTSIRLIYNADQNLKCALFSAADTFVSPANSFQETFGLSLVEAMLYQLPVIATKWSGYRDIVLDRQSGYLIGTSWKPPDDFSYIAVEHSSEIQRARTTASCVTIDWEEFGLRMQSLAVDQRLRDRLGLMGLLRARKLFTADKMALNFVEIWETLADQPISLGTREDLSESVDAVANALVAPFADAMSSDL